MILLGKGNRHEGRTYSGVPPVCLDFKWDNNEMPYEVDEETISSSAQIKVINNTIDKINLMTCGCFKIRYVYINKGTYTYIILLLKYLFEFAGLQHQMMLTKSSSETTQKYWDVRQMLVKRVEFNTFNLARDVLVRAPLVMSWCTQLDSFTNTKDQTEMNMSMLMNPASSKAMSTTSKLRKSC